MLVFVVITTIAELHALDIFVVNESERQLPIATLSFDGYDHLVLVAADNVQAQVAKLWKEAKEKEKQAKEIRSNKRIVQLLLAGESTKSGDLPILNVKKGEADSKEAKRKYE
ncbi:hypothetical protein ACHAWF_010046 [Thalassiosira exigua]